MAMINLTEFDAAFDPGPDTATAAAVPNGYFTVTFPDGTYKSFKIHTKRTTARFAPGARVVSLLIGPNNEEDYEPYAFLDNRGIRVWKRYRGTGRDKFTAILWRLLNGDPVAGYDILVSKRCLRCNRKLTTPESLERGVGEECWRIMNGG